MAAKYCLNCGYKNESLGAQIKKCAKCQTEFQAMAKDIIKIYKKEERDRQDALMVNDDELEQVEGSEFDSLMEGEPESITQDEIEKIFLANANRGFNLKDFLEEELDKVARASKQAKPKPKTKSARKKAK